MKTTLFALNEKLMLMEDVEEDAKNQKSYFLKSEQTRAQLQTHITETSVKMGEAQSKFETNVQSKIQEINELKTEIQGLKEKIAQKENQHFVSVENLNQKHQTEIQEKISEIEKIESQNL